MQCRTAIKFITCHSYGFASSKCSSTADKLSAFESDLLMMIKNVEFREITDVFQAKLQGDIKIVK